MNQPQNSELNRIVRQAEWVKNDLINKYRFGQLTKQEFVEHIKMLDLHFNKAAAELIEQPNVPPTA